MRLSHAGHQKLTIFGRAPGHGGPCERTARLIGYAGGPSVRRRCAEATAPQIAKSIGRRIYLAAEAALGARSRRRRPFGAAGGAGAAFLSLPGAVWSPPILSPTANGLLVAPGTRVCLRSPTTTAVVGLNFGGAELIAKLPAQQPPRLSLATKTRNRTPDEK